MRAVATLGGLMLGFLIAEIVLRILGVGITSRRIPHPTRGFTHPPNSAFDYSGEGLTQRIRYNRDGFRDENHPVVKPPGVYRIAVLGDSYVEAPQVAESDRFTEQLETECNRAGLAKERRVEVLNFGVSSYGTFQELQTLKDVVWQYQPDLVVLCLLTGNDFQNNCRELVDEPERPYLELRDGEYLEAFLRVASRKPGGLGPRGGSWPSSRLWGLWKKFRYIRFMQDKRLREARSFRFPDGDEARGFEAALDAAVYAPPKTPAWEHAWQITEELLRRFDRECRDQGVDWLLVTLSNGIQVHPDQSLRERFREAMGHPSLFYPEERLQAAAQRDSYPILCLAPLLLDVAEQDQVLLHGFANMQPGFGHWNELGHREAARLIADRWRRTAVDR